MLKDGEGGFSNQDIKVLREREKGKEAELDEVKKIVSEQALDAGAQFRMHMDGLTNLSDSLQDALMKLVGTMSMDDVLGQRIEHVSDALVLAKDYVQQADHSSEASFQDHTVEIRKKIFNLYTTEDEKQIFRQVFADES